MAEQVARTADRPERRWARRLLPAALVAAVLWWVAGLIGIHTRLALDVALAVFVVALVGLMRDTAPAWGTSMPAAAHDPEATRTTGDARLSYLRRTIEDATSTTSRADPGRAAPMGLQRSLRTVAAHRVGRRAGVSLDPDDRPALASRLDADLAEYLCATTPPPIDHQKLDDIVRRIEEL